MRNKVPAAAGVALLLVVVTAALWFAVQKNTEGMAQKISAEVQEVVKIKQHQAEIMLIRLDLNEYSELSTETKDVIAWSIDTMSKKYSLPPSLLHAIFQIESDYRFNIDHPAVKVKVKNQSKTINARGLGGVVWEFWSDSLKKHQIAETSSDLYIPKKNIHATAYILRTIIDDEMQKGRMEKPSNVIRRVIARYYGTADPGYEQKMKEVTSNLWLKRIARQILDKDTVSNEPASIFIQSQ